LAKIFFNKFSILPTKILQKTPPSSSGKMNRPLRSATQTNRMPSVLKISDLHEAYRSASTEDAIIMANLGALCYLATKAELYEKWSAADDPAKAELLRDEGRQTMLESVRARLAVAEEAVARAAAAEGVIQQLRASVDAEVERKLSEALEGHRKDYEITKMKEISALKERIAMSEGREATIEMVKESHIAMKEKIAALEAQLAQQIAANTKSSSAIGKQGETIVLDLLENIVCKLFQHATVKNMTGVPHAADFHLWVMAPTGQKIKFLIDSKKYKRPVNSDEINKLYEDMDGDEECQCGIMISIDSGICTKRQFCFSRTLKQKPVLFLTFQDLAPEIQKDVLCWGVQVLTEFVGEKNDAAKQTMLNNMDEFLDTMLASVKDIDGVIRDQMKAVAAMKEVRAKILKSVAVFRGQGEETDVKPVLAEELRCVGIKSDGNRCLSRRGVGSEYCKAHKK